MHKLGGNPTCDVSTTYQPPVYPSANTDARPGTWTVYTVRGDMRCKHTRRTRRAAWRAGVKMHMPLATYLPGMYTAPDRLHRAARVHVLDADHRAERNAAKRLRRGRS